MLRFLAVSLSLFIVIYVQPVEACNPQLSQAAQQQNQPAASATQAPEQVRAIAAPSNPLPTEAASAGMTRFSFVVYGDTRGRRDGVQEQYEHSLIIDSMVATIKRLAGSPLPVRFLLQTGDAVVNGGDARQWNKSFIDLINRITTEGGVPYFLAPGNHDVSGAPAPESPMR